MPPARIGASVGNVTGRGVGCRSASRQIRQRITFCPALQVQLLKLLASGGVKARAVRVDVERPFAQYNEHVEKIRALEREVERLQKQPERKQEPTSPLGTRARRPAEQG